MMALARGCDICGKPLFADYWDVSIQRKDAAREPDQDANTLNMDLCWSCLTTKLESSTELESSTDLRLKKESA